jgi:drug/metabolite transporter superfamily protein YnfA
MQQNDGNIEIGGSVDVSQQLGNQQQQVWNDVGARLSLANNVIMLTLDENSEPGQKFAQSPIVGFITQTT